eukprot:7360270-Prymnesium_polylepis.2
MMPAKRARAWATTGRRGTPRDVAERHGKYEYERTRPRDVARPGHSAHALQAVCYGSTGRGTRTGHASGTRNRHGGATRCRVCMCVLALSKYGTNG